MNNRFSLEYLEQQRKLLNRALESEVVACIDLEATCTDDVEAKASYRNEIIEIGMAVLDMRTLKVVDTHQIYVRPTTTEVLPFCTQLTGITPERVAGAPSYLQAVSTLESFVNDLGIGARGLWGSFGEYDRKQFLRQSAEEGCPDPMSAVQHMNVKAAAQIALQSRRGLGLNKAVAQLGLDFYGQHHSGLDDAVNVAHVLAEVARRLRA